MEGINIHKTRIILRNRVVYISLAVAFVIMLVFFPKEGKFKYEYHKGRPWLYETLISPIDFPILKTQAELLKERDEAASQVVPYYKFNDDILDNQLEELVKIQLKHNMPQYVEQVLVSGLKQIYSKGVIPDRNSNNQVQAKQRKSKYKTSYIIVQKGKRSYEDLEPSLYTIKKAERFLKSELLTCNPKYNVDSLFAIVQIKDIIVPNLIYDQATTDLLHKEAANYISPTKGMIYTGQLIVSEGETITAEIEQLLDSYKAEYKLSLGYTGSSLQLTFGHAILILVLLSLIYVTIYFVNFDMLREINKFSFILSVVTLTFLITVVVRSFDSSYLFMVPYAVFALYMMAFFQAKMVFPIYMISLIPLLVIAEYGVELYILNVFAGGVALFSFTYLSRGWLQFLNSLIIFIGLFIVHFAFRLIENGTFAGTNYTIILYIFLNALFVVAAYPLVFLLEKMFSLVSVATLRDLSDTNNTLLQELARKAPGTFQHSLQVANLAERAVAAIHGNSRLVKVGAMYHDVGKLNNPQCFIENQAPGIRYHEGLSPLESAKEIIQHVDNGVELAKKYKLPQIIVDYITSHHGRSQTGFFYTRYCNEGGNPANIADFTYRGTLPTTKEQVVVMMADAVEAASRSLKDYSAQSISNLVDGITSQRISDAQLIKADISIKEINVVKAVFKKHLQEVYHARIAYPTKKRDVKCEVTVTNETE
ncbi:MAG: HDIG domain-containing protein [Bacteroidales bacterium]